MIDFNTRKRIIKRLSDCAEKNVLLLIPCLIAAAFVKLFYAVVCSVDIALSDKNGNFLGIKPRKNKTTAPKKKQDDIVYVRRSLWGRSLSAILAASFAMTFMPGLSAFAGVSDYILDAATNKYYDSSLFVIEPVIDSSACVVGSGAYQVGWTYDTANAAGVTLTGFTVKYKAATGSLTTFQTVNSATRSVIITGLDSTTNYTFYVCANATIQSYTRTDTPDLDADGNPTGTTTTTYSASGTKAISSPDAFVSGTPNAALTSPNSTVIYQADTSSAEVTKKTFIYLDTETDDAYGYIIYRRNLDSTSASDVEVAKVTAANFHASAGYTPGARNLLYTDSSALAKTTLYSYVVVAYKGIFPTYTGAAYSAAKSSYYVFSPKENNYHEILTDTATPTNFKANTSAYDRITLTWTRVTNATGYYIYRYTETEFNTALPTGGVVFDDAHKLSTVAGATTTYVDTEIDNTVKYYYYISAYRTISDGGDDHESIPVGITGQINTLVKAPQSFTATPADGKVNLSWINSDNNDVAGYEIDISQKTGVDADGNPTFGTAVTIDSATVTYVHPDLYNGDTYKYVLRAYKIINGVKIYSTDVGPKIVTVGDAGFGIPQDFTATVSDGSVLLKWSAVKNATGYYLYITSSDGTVNRKDLSATTYTHSGLTNGDVYKYYVEAYRLVTGVKVSGDKSDVLTITVGIALDKPQDITASADDGSITVSWTKVNGATGYVIHATNLSGGGSLDIETAVTKYVHSGLTNGASWSYYVTAYKTVNGKRVYSDPSMTVSATVGIYLAAPKDISAVSSDGKVVISWTAVKGAEGYIVYATSSSGETKQFDVSKTSYTHNGVINGVRWTYYVKAYKIVNGSAVYSAASASVTASAGTFLAAPTDFAVTTNDASAVLSWTAVKGAEGYTVYAYKSGTNLQFDVSKTTYTHTGLINGDTWSYYVKAYKTVDGIRVYSNPTTTLSVKIGISLSAPTDLVADAGDRQIDLSWTKVKNAEGYVVYLYSPTTENFEPLTVVSTTKYSHTGLVNGTKYIYMVAAYRTISGERVYGDYSMAVSAYPTDGTTTNVDSILNIKGTAPYGISHSELISAAANHGAFDEPVDIYFSVNKDSTRAVKQVLKNYANGLSSFIIYPFDISAYKADTLVSVEPNTGYTITITMPVPDKLVPYREYITVVHIQTDGTETIYADDSQADLLTGTDLEVLPSALVNINEQWCIQFTTTSCSPFAFVIYKDNIEDVSSGASAGSVSFAGSFNTGLLLFTALPDIMPQEKKNRYVVSTKKYYRIKK